MSLSNKLRKAWEKALVKSQGKGWHVLLFPSYWHSNISMPCVSCIKDANYFTARPNRGAGIGHQMSNWHAGYWWAQQFGLRYAHSPFAQGSWERFLGYGAGEANISELKREGYKIVRIPMFDEYNPADMARTASIIESYRDRKVIFVAEQDQSYHDQIGVIPAIQDKFYNSVVRKSDLTPFDPEHFNIAIHVRRGDITIGQVNGDPNLRMRWLDNEYFEKVLAQVLDNLKTDKEIHIYIFSQCREEELESFKRFGNIHYYLDLNPESSFLSFVYADVLITSKSSFSYKPALLNRAGKKVCPANFWHAYPSDNDWILADDSGSIPEEEIKKINIR